MGVIILWLAFALVMGLGLLVVSRVGTWRSAPGTQVGLGLSIGVVAAFVLVALRTDLVPDDVEWVGIAGVLVIAAIGLAYLFVRAFAD